jgi:hypothetical protein
MIHDLNIISIAEYERLSEEEAKTIFKELCELNDNQNTIDLNFIRRLLSINNNNYSELFLKFITQYKIIDAMKKKQFSKDSSYNIVFNEEEFVNFITGKDNKDLLFEDNLDLAQKRFKIDDYAKLYELIGGNNDGISKNDLKDNILTVLKSLCKQENEDKLDEIAEMEAEEIIELLASKGSGLTPEDFMNIMTSNTPFPDKFEDIL